jgi:predicted NBD/HSP70 family sugar kinase
MTSPTAARPEAIRQHNLALVLGEVHRDGSLSRAELTSRLGLSRSTIGALVAELTDLGLVQESVPTGGARAGRPSHVVSPHPCGPYAIAVDVDIAHVTTAAIGLGGAVLGRRVFPLGPARSTPRAVTRLVVESIPILQEMLAGGDPVGIAVSVPGTVDRRTGTVGFAPNLEWRNEPFGSLLQAAAPGLAVDIGNDADLAVLAEHSRGAGRNCVDVVYVIGRVGVGAGIIVNGRPLLGHDGHAGEIGHNVMDPSGPECHCGKRGCLETYIGDKALLALAGVAAPATDENIRAVFAAARSGDVEALSAVRRIAESLGRGVAELVNVLNPERVILGGTLSQIFDVAGAEVLTAVARYAMDAPGSTVELCQPAFGEDSALMGAAEVAFARLLADPLSWRTNRQLSRSG